MDTLAFLLMILVFVASLAIQGGLQATFARYSRVANSRGLRGPRWPGRSWTPTASPTSG